MPVTSCPFLFARPAIAVALALLTTACGRDGTGRSPDAARVTGADIPKIDVHVHVAPRSANDAVRLFGANGIRVAVNASGGVPGQGLELSSEVARQTHGRLLFWCNFDFRRVEDPEWVDYVSSTLTRCKELGGRGLKIFKALGLGIVLSDGHLLAIDDPRLDIVFEKAADLGLPVLIHSGDPQAFFRAPSPDNERYAELRAHPDWSFYGNRAEERGGGRWPSWAEVFAQFERRVARHPRTTFVGAHFGNAAEDPALVGRMLDRNPRYVIDTAARVPEFGRHPARQMRAFFERYADRILFGSDTGIGPDHVTLGSSGEEPDTRDRVPFFFDAHWRYFETNGRRMAHPTPIQGRWRIDGIGLPREVLERLYWRNAARVLGIELPRR